MSILNKKYFLAIISINCIQVIFNLPFREDCTQYNNRDYKDNCGGCGICQRLYYNRSTHEEGFQCVYDMNKVNLTQYFDPKTTTKCVPANFCDSKEAKSECKSLACVPLFSTFKCKCGPTNIGRLCKNELGPGLSFHDYAVVENILYAPIVAANEPLIISILFSSLGKRNLQVEVETLLERNAYDLSTIKSVRFDEQYCKTLYPNYNTFCTDRKFNFTSVKWILNVRIFFPGREFDENRPYLYLGSSEYDKEEEFFIGNIEVVKMFVYSNKNPKPVFEETIRVADLSISPHFSPCEPVLTIRQGSDTAFALVAYARRNDIFIANFFKFTLSYFNNKPTVCFESVQDFAIHWKVWRYNLNHDESTTPPLEQRMEVPYVMFRAYTLDINPYKVRNNVSVIAFGAEGFSVFYSYFKVVELDLEVIIQGGDMKKIYYNISYLSLNASASKNPNLSHLEKNVDLYFSWQCDKCSKNKVVSKGDVITYQGPFEKNELYTFTLTIMSRLYKSKKVTSQKIFMDPDPIPTLDIVCRRNCAFSGFKSNPAEIIYLNVILSNSNNTEEKDKVKPVNKFTWTYSADGGKTYEPVEKIVQPNTPSEVFIVRENSLTAGARYVFRVEGGPQGGSSGQAEFNIQMAEIPQQTNFKCKMGSSDSPQCWVGFFENTIKCDRLLIDKLSPRYEFYDRRPDKNDTGRLITSGNANVAKYVGISRGRLVVEVTDRWGVMIYNFEIKCQLPLKYSTTPHELVQKVLDFLQMFQTTIDPEYKANAFAMVADLISDFKADFNNGIGKEIVKDLLNKGSKVDIYSYVSMKLWASASSILARTGFEFGLDFHDVLCLSEMLLKLSEVYLDIVKKSYDVLHEFTTAEISHISQMIMHSCNVVYLSRNHDLENGLVRKEDVYQEYFKHKLSILNIIVALKRIMLILSMRTTPFQSPLHLSADNITIWVQEDSPISFAHSNRKKYNDTIPSVQITDKLAYFLQDLSDIITIKVVVFNGNPFWWDHDLKIITNVVNLEIWDSKDSQKSLKQLKEPVSIQLDFLRPGESMINGTVQQPSSKDSIDKADQQVNVYRIRIEDRSALRLSFHNLKDGETFKVRVMRNLRPDYDYTTSGTVVSKSHPDFTEVLKEPNSPNLYDLDFLGILPGSEVPAGTLVNYSFSISIMHCASWDPIYGWNGEACEATKIDPDTKQLVCECRHFSSFAGFATEPMKTLNPFLDIEMFLDIRDNTLIAALIIFLLAAYVLTLFFALRNRRRDRGRVIYLEDNIPSDKFPYLIVVYTGSRMLTGTTSNVGIMVEGDVTVSRPHILRSSRYNTLQRGHDNWFIMYSRYHLGKIHMVKLWMDYSGRKPEWYVYKILVIDISDNIEYKFFINAWLSLRFGNYVERYVKVQDINEIEYKDLVDENLAFGFREAHFWLATFLSHPRSALTKAERLSVIFCSVFVVMLVSSIYYGSKHQEEYPEFSITNEQLYVGAIGWIGVAIVVGTLVMIFRASLNVKSLQGSHTNLSPKKRRKFTFNPFLKLCHALRKIFLWKKKFVPVHCGLDIARSYQFIHVYTDHQFTYLAWFLCISIILVCSIFIIMKAIKFGNVRCLEWLSSVVLSLAQDIFLVSPLKVILITIISIITYTRIYDAAKYDIDWNVVRSYKNHLFQNDPYIGVKLVSERSRKIYIPLTYKELTKKQSKDYFYHAIWLLLDILVIAFFSIMLLIQSNTLWTTKFYWNNHELKALIMRGFEAEGYRQSAIGNASDYLPVLTENVFPLIYRTQWYNGRPLRQLDSKITSLAYTFDGSACLLGLPRIRQLRLKPGLCKKSFPESLPMVCPNRVNAETEDTDIYRELWKSSGTFESFEVTSMWDYRNASSTFDKTTYGTTGLGYDAGGYVADLGNTRTLSVDMVQYLITKNWIDRRTAALLFEVSIYNPNAGTISSVTAITEVLHIGLLINKIYVYTADQKYNVFLIDILVFVFLCAFIVRLILVLNRRGVRHLLFDFWNRFELIIVILNIYWAVLYMINIQETNKYLRSYRTNTNMHFEFQHLIRILTDTELVFVILYLMVMCRFLKNWNFGIVFDRLFYTLWSQWSSVMWLFISICLLTLVYWKLIVYYLYQFIQNRLFTLFLVKLDYKQTANQCDLPSCKIILYIACAICNLFLLMIIIHYISSYRIIKQSRSEEEDEYNLFTLLFNKRNREKDRKQHVVRHH